MFTERLAKGLRQCGVCADISWLPPRAEYAPWTVAVPAPPAWANVVHVNTWLHERFIPHDLAVVATMHLCVHDPALTPYKASLQRLYHRFWVRHLEERVLRHAQQLVAVSRYTAERTHMAFGCTLPRTIHNGIDLSGPLQPGPRRPPQRPFRLLYVGNWSARKGVDLLAPILHALGPDFELYYTADRTGSESRWPLPENAHALGRVDSPQQMAETYRQADALLFPSRTEGLPLAPLEAMACGLPVIAAQTSSLPELVEHGTTGYLCPQDDIHSFVSAARRLADDPHTWDAMRRAARRRVESDFNHEHMVDCYLDLYREVAT